MTESETSPGGPPTTRAGPLDFTHRALMAGAFWVACFGALFLFMRVELWIGFVACLAWLLSVCTALVPALTTKKNKDGPEPPHFQFSLRAMMASVLWMGFCGSLYAMGLSEGWVLRVLGVVGLAFWAGRVWFALIDDHPVPWAPRSASPGPAPEPRA